LYITPLTAARADTLARYFTPTISAVEQ